MSLCHSYCSGPAVPPEPLALSKQPGGTVKTTKWVSKHKDMPGPGRDDIAPVCCLAPGSLREYNKDFLSAIRFPCIPPRPGMR
ncbi:hypothetical protein EYF80_015410 [Liparis tanakae]|uniref:Uncharacterized protein n=1 Tax=Liparis tanakae TaxID=230148 RepID=A0A4Z2I8M2_9TELE|nr:hypothetical protein EYF80_015410 [Liparis tanakae]